jgi:hypothetical protein
VELVYVTHVEQHLSDPEKTTFIFEKISCMYVEEGIN